MTRRIQIIIVDHRCPICDSDQIRSKIQDDEEDWWYICDNWDDPHAVTIAGVDRNLNEVKDARMFYFNPTTGAIEVPGVPGLVYLLKED